MRQGFLADSQQSLPKATEAPWWRIINQGQQNLFGPEGTKALKWLNQRGLSQNTLKRWMVGYNPTDQRIEGIFVSRGILIPGINWEGRLSYIKIRRPVPHVPGPKYTGVKGSVHCLFGLHEISPGKPVLICEGEFDAMLAWQILSGEINVVALPSASYRPGNHEELILYQSQLWLIATDTDRAGNAAARQWLKYEPAVRVSVPWGKDITEFVLGGGDLASWLRSCIEQNKGRAVGSISRLSSTGRAPAL